MKRWLRFGLLMFSAGLAGTVHAQTCTNTAGGDWSNTAIWTCAAPAGPRVPTNADNVTIITNTTIVIIMIFSPLVFNFNRMGLEHLP